MTENDHDDTIASLRALRQMPDEPVDAETLVAQGIRGGRRRQHNRRVGVLAGVAAVTLLGIGAYVVRPGDPGMAAGPPPTTASATSQQPSATATPSTAAPSTPAGPNGSTTGDPTTRPPSTATTRTTPTGTKGPSTSSSTPASPTGGSQDFPDVGYTATFPYFTVEVESVKGSVATGWIYSSFMARVCVVGMPPGQSTISITAAPWSYVTHDGHVARFQPAGSGAARSPAYPETGQYSLGECASGYLTFMFTSDELTTGAPRTLRYSNSLGNQASWRIQ